jgi:hypothetical protein
MTTNELCKSILERPCPYTKPPFKIGTHEFCTCISEAIRQAYIGGYKAGKANEIPEVGREEVTEGTDEKTAS